jgi:hypothetical protein
MRARIGGMTIDRRKDTKLTADDVKKILNRKQLSALHQCQYFGWKLKFIRSPLFQEPVPVLYNAKIDRIGILDPDGHINMDLDFEVRSDRSEPDRIKRSPQAQKSPETASRKERRTHKARLPDDLVELLNQHQMSALRQIETFGWKLHFVRRSLFQEPIVAILSPEGDMLATLERDGRINMAPDLALRKEAPVERTESALSVSDQKSSEAK